jgi:hypothetical protein
MNPSVGVVNSAELKTHDICRHNVALDSVEQDA